MTVPMIFVTGCSEFREGEGVLTDEHPASSHGQPVWVWANGDVAGPGDMPRFGYLHRRQDVAYHAEQVGWVSELIIAAHCEPVDLYRGWSTPSAHFRFGGSWKTAAQRTEIERRKGERLFLA